MNVPLYSKLDMRLKTNVKLKDYRFTSAIVSPQLFLLVKF
jgi:hypothetical protein